MSGNSKIWALRKQQNCRSYNDMSLYPYNDMSLYTDLACPKNHKNQVKTSTFIAEIYFYDISTIQVVLNNFFCLTDSVACSFHTVLAQNFNTISSSVLVSTCYCCFHGATR